MDELRKGRANGVFIYPHVLSLLFLPGLAAPEGSVEPERLTQVWQEVSRAEEMDTGL